MNIKISEEMRKCQQDNIPDLPLVFKVIPRQVVNDVLIETKTKESRNRKLCSELVIWLCIVMNWLPRHSLSSVMGKLCQILTLSRSITQVLASDGGICQARYRVGAKPLEVLFKRIGRPMATPSTIGAYHFGKRLVGFDGTLESVADTPANEAYFGRSSGSHGDSAFPQLRAVYACELGTHIIFDAVIGHFRQGEHTLTRRLLRCVESDMLVFLDAGLSSFDLLAGIVNRGGNVIARSHNNRKWKPICFLPDGSFLAWMKPTDKSHNPKAKPLLVRILRYRLDDETRPHHDEIQTLVTTLLDPIAYPALEVIDLFHQRWEIEIAIDEMDTHQRLANRPFRSLKPLGVIQEFYAFLLAYFVIRVTMLDTATANLLDPDRLSFIESVHLIVDTLPIFQLIPKPYRPQLFEWVQQWVIHYQLPPRRDRSNPRVIKRRRTKFPRKQPRHFNTPQPTKPFREAVVMLT